MKKRFISFLLILVLLVSTSGFAYAAGRQSSRILELTISDWAFMHGDVPAESDATEGMLPPLHALAMCMIERDLPYQDDSARFLWSSLYYMLSLHGEMDTRAELTDGALIVPTEVVQDYAAAMFADYNGLPALPVELAEFVFYDETNDCYHLTRGDAGESTTVLDGAMKNGDGSYHVEGRMVALDNGGTICSFTAEMTANESMFGYAVDKMTIF